MKDSNPIDIFNDFKSGKIAKSSIIDKLFTLIQISQDDLTKIQVIELLVENFLLDAEDIIKWIIENEKSTDCLFELYRFLEVRGEAADELRQFMELKLGRDVLKKYNLIPKEAMALELFGRVLCSHLLHARIDNWTFHYIKTKKGKVTGIEIDRVFDIVDSKYLKLFSGIRELVLADCNLTDFSFLKGLTKLSLNGTEDSYLKDIVEIKGLENLTNLEELDLSRNYISEIKNLDKLMNLRKLDLSQNCIKEIQNLDSLSKLEYLNLAENNINEINGLDKLVNLLELDLSNNKEILEIKSLENLSRLEVLKLENNYLIKEIKGLNTLVNLKKLDLSKDDFMISESGAELTYNFRSLILKNKEIFAVKLDDREYDEKERNMKILEKILELENYEDEEVQKELDYYRHYITEIKGLDKLRNLEELDLTGNQITEIKGLDRLRKLKILRLDNNDIVEIKGLENQTNLDFLGLSGNKIEPNPELGPLNKQGYSVRDPQKYVKFCQEKYDFI
jgi:Leucine-rich repeat (LRR) protein